MITVRPNVTSSELKALIANRANSHCSATPMAKKHGTITSSVASGFMPPTAES